MQARAPRRGGLVIIQLPRRIRRADPFADYRVKLGLSGVDRLEQSVQARTAHDVADPAQLDVLLLQEVVVRERGAANLDNAYAFINFLLKPDVMAGISSYTSYANAITASKPLIDASVSNNPNIYPSEDVRKKIFPLEPLTAKVSRQYTDMWSAMKSGK